ncbi:MAG: hypothetical protein F6K54_29530 [Okeania sp. SIO3B5]|uniref:hypothetical protein n=1 Tax=Okeania sp. SIO3B5 TaxID=2607811 RepID=UPI0013FF99E2|nr:hypothetical protein [Okeania sp. SIO3B5]NEO56853.1 hypothetical protein [Okeania sp. SIO3B5]
MVWNKLETSNGEEPPTQTLKIIADILQGKINTEPDFVREVEEVQKIFETELQSSSSTDFQEYVRQIQRLTNKIKVLQKDVDDIKQEIKENVSKGDYLGKDPGILSGNQNFIQNINQGNSNFLADTNIKADAKFIHLNKEYTQRILTQIEQIKGKITQFFTVKESMDELDKIRQLYPISVFDVISDLTFQNLEIFFKLVFALGKFIKKNIKNYINQDDELITAGKYFEQIRKIQSQIGENPEEDKVLLQSLGSIADEVNLQISKLNNSFILALYPASSSK